MAAFPEPPEIETESAELPEEEMAAMPEPITISPEQADAAGLSGCQPGDTYTATLTVANVAPEGTTLEISGAEPSGPQPAMGMKSQVKGPEDLGIDIGY